MTKIKNSLSKDNIPSSMLTMAEEACNEMKVSLDDLSFRSDHEGNIIANHNTRFIFSFDPKRKDSFSYRLKNKHVFQTIKAHYPATQD